MNPRHHNYLPRDSLRSYGARERLLSGISLPFGAAEGRRTTFNLRGKCGICQHHSTHPRQLAVNWSPSTATRPTKHLGGDSPQGANCGEDSGVAHIRVGSCSESLVSKAAQHTQHSLCQAAAYVRHAIAFSSVVKQSSYSPYLKAGRICRQTRLLMGSMRSGSTWLQSSSVMSKSTSASVCSMRSGEDMPTIVEATRSSRVENCRATAASGTRCS